MLNTFLTFVGIFLAGVALGAWVTKHPDDARGYLESAGAKFKTLTARIFRRTTHTSTETSSNGSSDK